MIRIMDYYRHFKGEFLNNVVKKLRCGKWNREFCQFEKADIIFTSERAYIVRYAESINDMVRYWNYETLFYCIVHLPKNTHEKSL